MKKIQILNLISVFFFYKQILLIRIGNKLFVNFVIKISSRIFDSNGYINITSVDSDFYIYTYSGFHTSNVFEECVKDTQLQNIMYNTRGSLFFLRTD